MLWWISALTMRRWQLGSASKVERRRSGSESMIRGFAEVRPDSGVLTVSNTETRTFVRLKTIETTAEL
jgi:hypothetical protein